MNNELFDKLLRNALMDAAKIDYADTISNTEDMPPSFSKRYLKRKNELKRNPYDFKKDKVTSIWNLIVTKRVVAAVVAIFVLFGSLMIIPEVRAAVKRFVFELFDDHTTISFLEIKTENNDTENWYPEYIPEGFSETLYDNTLGDITAVWDNGPIRLTFTATRISEGVNITIDSEHSTPHDIMIGNTEATLYIANDSESFSYIIWSSDNLETLFVLSSQIDYSELIKIAESVN